MIVSGAVFANNHVHIDRLIRPVWLVFQPFQKFAMTSVAMVLKVLKLQLKDLCKLYTDTTKDDQPAFPFFRKVHEATLSYKQCIKPNLYLCSLISGQKVVTKFVEGRYAIRIHQYMAKMGYAPEVIFYEERLTTRYCVVVMEYIEGAETLDHCIKRGHKFSKKIFGHCKEVIDYMHTKNYCHGDLRANNILVMNLNNEPRIKVVDFNWAGEAESSTYPGFMNHADITWPEGAAAGKQLQLSHDLYWFQQWVTRLDHVNC